MDFTGRGRYDSETGSHLMILRTLFPKIYFSISPINIESFCFIICISFHMLEPTTNYQLFRLTIGPKTNYQLFKVIIGFGYKETITGSQDHPMLSS